MNSENCDLAQHPCPDRILEDLGGAFTMGSFGGFLLHYGKGFFISPPGQRFSTAFYNARHRSALLGGNFAVWGGTFSTFDCSLQFLRKKDDHWNAILSGAGTGGLLAIRGGWLASTKQAAVGGVLLAIIEGVMAVFSRTSNTTPRDQYYHSLKLEKELNDNKKKKEHGSNSFYSFLSPSYWSVGRSNDQELHIKNDNLNTLSPTSSNRSDISLSLE